MRSWCTVEINKICIFKLTYINFVVLNVKRITQMTHITSTCRHNMMHISSGRNPERELYFIKGYTAGPVLATLGQHAKSWRLNEKATVTADLSLSYPTCNYKSSKEDVKQTANTCTLLIIMLPVLKHLLTCIYDSHIVWQWQPIISS